MHPTPGALIQRGPRARGTDNRAIIVLKPFPARNRPSRDASRRGPGGVYLWRSPAVSSLDVVIGMQEAARRRDPEAEAAIAEVERLLREVRPRSAEATPPTPAPPRDPAAGTPAARPRRWLLGRLFGWLQQPARVAQSITAELRAAPCPACTRDNVLFRRLEVRWTPQELTQGQALRRVEVACPDTGQRFTLPVRFVQS